MLVVLGYEIDSERAYREAVTSSMEYFGDLVEEQWKVGAAAPSGLGAALITKFGWPGLLLTLGGGAIAVGIDALIAWWAPADPILHDAIGLSVNDLATLTSVNAPAPEPTSYTTEHGIVVKVHSPAPPVKLPLQYHETRAYVGEDSRYYLAYRFNQVE